jgi:uncharacterized protein DUF4412
MFDRLRLALLTLFLATAGLQAQGLYWESTSTGPRVPGGKPLTAKNYAAPKKHKIDHGEQIIIFRLDQEKMYVVNPAKKTYSEMTFADLEAAAEAQKEMMKKQLEFMPPEQRKALEKQLGTGKDAKVEVEKTSEKRDIAGRSSMKHVVKEDGKETMTVWVTDDVKEYKSLKADFDALTKRMGALNPGMKGIAAAAEKIEGFPVEKDMKEMGKETVTKIESRSVPDSEFEVPADYTKTPSPFEALGGAAKGKAKAKGKDKAEGAPEKKKE